jgi:nucleoside-diphosphate-sugar epimerase
MRVVVTGATGNVGTSVLRALADEPSVSSILGVARRLPRLAAAKTEFAVADVAVDDLRPHFRGADAVIHLAWLIQPSRDLRTLTAVNVEGSARVLEAVAAERVPTLLYASSVGAYAPGPKDRAVDESWPATGIQTSFYGRHKGAVEALLDRFEREHSDVRVVRLRQALVFKRDAAEGIRRLFAGPFLPSPLMAPGRIPFVPRTPRLVFQAVHSFDVGEAYRLALRADVRGPFNIAAEPVLGPDELARILRCRTVPVPARALRAAAAASWRLRLQPTPPGWVDLALGVPVMGSDRAARELGFVARHSAEQALLEVVAGIRDGAGIETPPLSPGTSGRLRHRELATGVGRRSL